VPRWNSAGLCIASQWIKKQSKKDELPALFPQGIYPVSMPEKGLKTSKNGLASPSGKSDGCAGEKLLMFFRSN
jgi:hypothetical protein